MLSPPYSLSLSPALSHLRPLPAPPSLTYSKIHPVSFALLSRKPRHPAETQLVPRSGNDSICVCPCALAIRHAASPRVLSVSLNPQRRRKSVGPVRFVRTRPASDKIYAWRASCRKRTRRPRHADTKQHAQFAHRHVNAHTPHNDTTKSEFSPKRSRFEHGSIGTCAPCVCRPLSAKSSRCFRCYFLRVREGERDPGDPGEGWE